MAVSGIQASLYEIHGLLAAIVAAPELALEQEDCKALAVAIHGVGQHYQLPAFNPAHMAIGALIWTAGRIYLPRVRALAERKNAPPAPPGQAAGQNADLPPGTSTVVDFAAHAAAPVAPWFAGNGSAPPAPQ